jgi:hypothetical protein
VGRESVDAGRDCDSATTNRFEISKLAYEGLLAVLDAYTLADLIKPRRALSSLLFDRRVSLPHT